MKKNCASTPLQFLGGILLLAAACPSQAAMVLKSPTGFSAGILVTGFDDGDGVWDLTMTNPEGTLQFENVDTTGDVHGFGQFTLIDNPGFILHYDLSGDTVFSGLLQTSISASPLTFAGDTSPLQLGDAWSITYDGNSSYNIFSPLPSLPAVSLGDIAGSMRITLDSINGADYHFNVVETIPSESPDWTGFEGLLDNIDLLGVPFGGTRNRIDGGLSIAADSRLTTPLPPTLALLGAALGTLGLGGWRRRADSTSDR